MISFQYAAAVYMYAVPPILLRVVLLVLPLLEGKIWRGLKNKTPREIMIIDREEKAQKTALKLAVFNLSLN